MIAMLPSSTTARSDGAGHGRGLWAIKRAVALACGAAMLLVLASPALAQDGKKKKPRDAGGPTAQDLLAAVDKDGDGRISREEFFREAYERYLKGQKPKGDKSPKKGPMSFEDYRKTPQLVDRFRTYDKDGSGYLERPEIEAMARDMRRERRRGLAEFIRRYDDNGDGKVTRDEFRGPDAVFDRLDRNGDGVIDERDEPDVQLPPLPPAPPATPPAAPPPRAAPAKRERRPETTPDPAAGSAEPAPRPRGPPSGPSGPY